MTKLFLSTPCYGGLCLEKYMTSIIKLQLLLVKENIQLFLILLKMNHSFIVRGM